MKTNQKYLLVSLVAFITVTGMSLGALSFAQAVPTLGCSVNAASVGVGQAAILTASGGNGDYIWSGPNLDVTNAAGTEFAVSYPNTGVYPITVTSAGQTATCNVNVIATSLGNLMCTPSVQNVDLGQVASVSVTGGNGTYVWSSPDLDITNVNGSGFSANYASTGLQTLTVTSAGLTTTCAINVLPDPITPTPIVTPGLPDTGGGYGQ